ncbi:MAG: helix-turn-helix domain-containing protein [Phycisphaerae bacterium]
MATKIKIPKADADTYMDLIQRFPLKPLKDDAAHEQAVEMVAELMGRKLDDGASDYLDTLILLVNKYEDEHHTPMGMDLTPQQALRAIMEANNLTQADIGRILGSESAVSMFLNGERGLSKVQIKLLVQKFRVDANLFL